MTDPKKPAQAPAPSNVQQPVPAAAAPAANAPASAPQNPAELGYEEIRKINGPILTGDADSWRRAAESAKRKEDESDAYIAGRIAEGQAKRAAEAAKKKPDGKGR